MTPTAGDVVLSRCEACDAVSFPPPACCPKCQGPVVNLSVPGRGSVFTYTVVHHAYRDDVVTPYVVALVELDQYPGVRVIANIVDCDPNSVHIGMAVEGRRGARPQAAAPQLAPAR